MEWTLDVVIHLSARFSESSETLVFDSLKLWHGLEALSSSMSFALIAHTGHADVLKNMTEGVDPSLHI